LEYKKVIPVTRGANWTVSKSDSTSATYR